MDTIAAIATPTGSGGVGIIRVSGPLSQSLALRLLGSVPKPRYADYLPVFDTQGEMIDQGICIFFARPHSFTGEDVIEFQIHGGVVVLNRLLTTIVQQGIRLAGPGEFLQRAFLNDKLDLTQAEAIADLISASSVQAARCALRSLQGEFSKQIDQLLQQLIELRVYVEAAIDFPEEEIDFLSNSHVSQSLQQLQQQLDQVLCAANQGALMREGIKLVLLGRPNAGKSSLLNALAGYDAAIVSEVAGTTRDLIQEQIHIDGMPVHIVDTAGLHDTQDRVEQIGIARALKTLEDADHIVLIVDSVECTAPVGTDDLARLFPQLNALLVNQAQGMLPITLVRNKIDLSNEVAGLSIEQDLPCIRLSAKQAQGIDSLREHLKQCMGFAVNETGFIARKRHLDALQQAQQALQNGWVQLSDYAAGELLAEELRTAQQALAEITGEFTSDDLLGHIFSSFCIGK